ncbi:MAG: TonB-dependent receptor [Prevotellaceae bacterium]|jgi:iron complex outermembrane receptor protein|nr:TonB-dependent receptor [Prevotellaceae bacterium]
MRNQKFCFRHFTRKGYGIFASLGKEIKIGVLAATCSLVVMVPQKGFANTPSDTTQAMKLDEVEVVAERPELFADLLRATTVLNREEIEAAPVQNLQDLLEFTGAVDIRQRGVNGAQADISLRGSSADQVLVLLNGINITDVQTGHYNLNIPVDLSAVERIEILQGSGSRMLGTAAFGGAINIVTGTEKRSGVNLGVATGEYGYSYQNANASYWHTNATHSVSTTSLSLSRQRSSGYIENTDFDAANIYLQHSYDSKKMGKLQLQLGMQDKGVGANNFYYPVGFGASEYEWGRTFLATLSWRKAFSDKIGIAAQAYWRELNNRYEAYRDFINAPVSYTEHNYHRTDLTGGQLKLERRSAHDKTTVGVDIRNEHILSTKLGDPLASSRPVLFAPDSICFAFGKNRLQTTVFTDEVLYLGKLTFAAGIALNYSGDYGTNFSGGIDVDYRFSNALSLFCNANRAFRFPTFTDLYYSTDESHTADPNLKPEHATTLEAGAKYNKGGFRLKTDVYYRIGTDIIDWMRPFASAENPSPKWQGAQGDINTLGADVALRYDFRKSFLKNAGFSYSFITQDKDQIAGYDSRYAMDYLRHKIVFELQHWLYKNLSLHWNVLWQDRNGDYTLNEQRKEYKPFFLFDARLAWDSERVNVFADFNNIFDKEYADFGGIIQCGRSIRTGIRVKL